MSDQENSDSNAKEQELAKQLSTYADGFTAFSFVQGAAFCFLVAQNAAVACELRSQWVAAEVCLAVAGADGDGRAERERKEAAMAAATEYDIPHVAESLDALVKDPLVDQVLVLTTSQQHEEGKPMSLPSPSARVCPGFSASG
jgi:hypothetical protein